MKRPLQHAIYKGMTGKWGAIQFGFHPPHYYLDKQKDYSGDIATHAGSLKPGWKIREGTIFLEITSSKDKNVYDWDNKIVLALSATDVGKILHSFYTGTECKIMHDPGAKKESQGLIKKNLYIASPKGTANGCMIRAVQSQGGQQKNHSVPITGDELIILKILFESSVPGMLAWK